MAAADIALGAGRAARAVMPRPSRSSIAALAALAAVAALAAITVIALVVHPHAADRKPSAAAARDSLPVRIPSWEDHAARVAPPPGYIPAWKVRPPRPLEDAPPAPRASAAAPAIDPVHAVDGDRPPRPIPGLAHEAR